VVPAQNGADDDSSNDDEPTIAMPHSHTHIGTKYPVQGIPPHCDIYIYIYIYIYCNLHNTNLSTHTTLRGWTFEVGEIKTDSLHNEQITKHNSTTLYPHC